MAQVSQTVHVIDDDDAVRSALCALLEANGHTATPHASCEGFLAMFSREEVLCIVADLRLPGMGGLQLQSHLLEAGINLPFIVITGHGDVSSAVRALKAGAADFIEKPVDGKLLLAAVGRAVAARQLQMHGAAETDLARKRITSLTPRESDILRHLVAGNPNKVIAHQLGISPRTVENHRARLMDKMKVDSVAGLVRLALAAGLAPGAADTDANAKPR
jgi:two-component system, LuxR family, response regulator FixJ